MIIYKFIIITIIRADSGKYYVYEFRRGRLRTTPMKKNNIIIYYSCIIVLYGSETFVDSSSHVLISIVFLVASGKLRGSRLIRPIRYIYRYAVLGLAAASSSKTKKNHTYSRTPTEQRGVSSSRGVPTGQNYNGYRVDVLNLRVIVRSTAAVYKINNSRDIYVL